MQGIQKLRISEYVAKFLKICIIKWKPLGMSDKMKYGNTEFGVLQVEKSYGILPAEEN